MGVLSIIELIIELLGGVASAFNKAGLSELAAGIQAAIAELQKVQGTPVTKAQLDALRLTPKW